MNDNLETLKKRLSPHLPALSQLGHDVIKTYPPESVSPEIAGRILVPVPMPMLLMMIAICLGTGAVNEKDVTPQSPVQEGEHD